MSTVVYFEVQSSDPEREARFYHSVFNWDIVRDGHAPFPYHRIMTDGLDGAIVGRPLPQPDAPSGTNAFTCSVRVDDFEATADLIVSLGGRVVLPKFAIAQLGWQGYFADPDHNIFGIFQEDTSAEVDENYSCLITNFSHHVSRFKAAHGSVETSQPETEELGELLSPQSGA
ncbi:MAG: VOC family protein [Propionibacteriaceae bacterium]|jgi:predicted enzyme related to lactoylglutathione lyase|nr:VOC family protein [Propionibacteriaceae bacterium]